MLTEVTKPKIRSNSVSETTAWSKSSPSRASVKHVYPACSQSGQPSGLAVRNSLIAPERGTAAGADGAAACGRSSADDAVDGGR